MKCDTNVSITITMTDSEYYILIKMLSQTAKILDELGDSCHVPWLEISTLHEKLASLIRYAPQTKEGD